MKQPNLTYYSVKMYLPDEDEVNQWRNILDFNEAQELYNNWCSYETNKVVLEMTTVLSYGTSTITKAIYDPEEGKGYLEIL